MKDKRQKGKKTKDKRQKNFRLSIFQSLYLSSVFILLCAACAAVKPAQQAERNFYREYSQKLGVHLQGNEHKELIRVSTQWLGTPYKYGGNSQKGIDCSAFVGVVYKNALGVTLPRNSSAIAKSVTKVSRSNLQCGDIVFFTNKEKRISHVGIYLSGGNFVHASTSKGVSVASLSNTYWNRYFAGAGRVKGAITAQRVEKSKPARSVAKSSAAVESKPAAATVANKPPAAEKPDKTQTQAAPAASTSVGATEKVVADDLIIVFDEDF